MHQQIKLMLQMQDEMNQKVNHDWRDKKREWYRAIWIECAELMDHHGWKWWKKQANDIEQVQLEIIDIWHFGLSMLLESSNNQNKLADHIADDFSNTSTSSTQLLEAVETFAGETLSTRTFSTSKFKSLMDASQMSVNDLYVGYVGKNTLNLFRQDFGYKDGSYIKEWAGKEDNEHLVEITQELDVSALSFKDDLYNGLKNRYQSLTQTN